MWAWSESERTLLSSDGDTFYNFSGGDDGEGVGYCDTYVTGGYRLLLRLGLQAAHVLRVHADRLRGKRVLDATFRVTERWSMSCEKTTVRPCPHPQHLLRDAVAGADQQLGPSG